MWQQTTPKIVLIYSGMCMTISFVLHKLCVKMWPAGVLQICILMIPFLWPVLFQVTRERRMCRPSVSTFFTFLCLWSILIKYVVNEICILWDFGLLSTRDMYGRSVRLQRGVPPLWLFLSFLLSPDLLRELNQHLFLTQGQSKWFIGGQFRLN